MMNVGNRYQNKHNEQIEQLEREIKEAEEAAAKETQVEEKELSPEEQSFKKRYGDLRRFSQKREDELRRELDTLKNEMSVLKREKVDFPQANLTEEEFQTWANSYPDVYAKVLRIAEKQAKLATQELQEKVKKQEERDLERERADAYRELLKVHPDFDEIKVTEDFVEWAEAQPLWVYNALYNNDTDAAAASRAVDLYKLDRKPKKKEKDKSDEARSIRTPSAGPAISSNPDLKFTESQVAKMSWREYEKNEEEINKAMKNPAFYDLSGGAR